MKLSAEEQQEILDKIFETGLLLSPVNSGRAWFDIATFNKLVKDKNIDVQVYGYRDRGNSHYEVSMFKNGTVQVACQRSEYLIEAFILALGEVFDVLPEKFIAKKPVLEVFPINSYHVSREIKEILDEEIFGSRTVDRFILNSDSVSGT